MAEETRQDFAQSLAACPGGWTPGSLSRQGCDAAAGKSCTGAILTAGFAVDCFARPRFGGDDTQEDDHPVMVFAEPLFFAWPARFGALCVLVLGMSASTVTAETRPARPAIRLSCPAEGAEALCRDLTQVLARAAPGSVIRRVAPGQERPARPGDLGVALRRQADGGLRLLWQGLQDPAPHEIRPSAGMGGLAPAAQARALLEASPDLRKALARLTAP